MNNSLIPDELVSLIQAISEDKNLCERILSFQQIPAVMCQTELLNIAARMRSAGENKAMVEAVAMLADPLLYDAACSTLCEIRRLWF